MKYAKPVHIGTFVNRTAYIAVHGKWVYLFEALDDANTHTGGDMLEHLARTAKFSPPQAPGEHLKEWFANPISVFGSITLNGPRILRPVHQEQNVLVLGIYDCSKGPIDDVFIVNMTHIQAPAPKKFADIEKTYSAGMQKALKLAEPLVWKEQKDVPGLFVTQPVKFDPNVDGAQKKVTEKKVTERVGMLELEPGDFVQILFTLSADLSDAQVQQYIELSDRILATIKPISQKESH
jgi:hypothetical protein